MSLTKYAVGSGWNVAENALTVLDPQPASPEGVVPSELDYYGDLSVQPEGVEIETLIWSAISQAERNTALSVIGLTESAPSKQVTFMVLTNSRSWLRVNCVAAWLRGTDKRAKFGLNNLTVELRGVEAAS